MSEIILNNPNLMLVGPWNIGILTPTWLKKYFPKIITDDVIPVDVKIGALPEFIFTIGDILITINNNRISFRSKIYNKETCDNIILLANGIVEKLHHTPILAIGHNLEYKLATEEKLNIFDNQKIENYSEFYSSFIQNGSLNSQQIRHSIAFEEKILNLSFKLEKSQKIIEFNYHYNINSSSDKNKIIKEFNDNISLSKTYLKKLIN